jgi:hypothetical protein
MNPYIALINVLATSMCPEGIDACEGVRDENKCRRCWCEFSEELAREEAGSVKDE